MNEITNMFVGLTNTISENFHSTIFLIDYIISCLAIIFVLAFIYRYVKVKSIRIGYSILFAILIATITLNFSIGSMVTALIIIVFTIAILILTGNELRSVLRDEFHFSGIFSIKKNKVEKNTDGELCDALSSAIIAMSHDKCGALITIEKEDRITTDRFSRWSDLDAEVTNELLRTIFYKGTPLHDGATIIREGRIIRAGVIFDSVSVSNKAMPGSLGSRHRAAVGITEVYDCIAITVSEETGSIHICHNGHIEKCFASNIKDKLVEILNTKTDEDSENQEETK